MNNKNNQTIRNLNEICIFSFFFSLFPFFIILYQFIGPLYFIFYLIVIPYSLIIIDLMPALNSEYPKFFLDYLLKSFINIIL